MSVIGNVVTRHFRLPLRYSLLVKKQRTYSFLAPKSSRYYLSKFQRNFLSINPSVNIRTCTIVRCQSKEMGALSPLDPSSFSRPEQAIVKHVDLAINVDFEKKVLQGTAVLTIQVLDYVTEVVLDSSNLTIESIELNDGTPLKHTLADPISNYGSKLTIYLPQSAAPESKFQVFGQTKWTQIEHKMNLKNDPVQKVPMTFTGFMYKPLTPNFVTENLDESCDSVALEQISSTCICAHPVHSASSEYFVQNNMLQIKIKYTTAPGATALQWLEPNQTSGKKHPYMFSQCQPIHARSILPCQDTPAVKFTYEAEVTAPEEFTVLMSAIRGDNKSNKTTFSQPVPIPSYLLAIAVGVLESRKLGPRSHVWSEKAEIERSAWEFAETEKYLQAAERLCGPYQWSQYDLLVLPPSFPYGGMENPCLTFVTPTLLAGDRSQADVIVHEIMHSWTGNLVTNRNFEHFWLNEGFTVFLERKVGASLIANPDEAKKSRDFHSLLGLQELKETIVSNLGENNPLTNLVPDLNSTHPDDAFSRVPYEKGSLFLRYLEDMLGGPEVFDEFLRSYLNTFQRKSLDTEQFKAYLLNYFKDNKNLSNIDWETWLHKSGMPPVIPEYDTSMTKAVSALLTKISEANSTLTYEDVRSFTPHQIINLLQALIDREALSLDKLHELGAAYKVSTSKNTEITYRWLRLCIRSKDEAKLNEAFAFVNQQGRMKYVRPIYRDLYAWEDVRERAIENFLKNEPYMMHVSAYTLRKDLHLSE